MEQGSGEALASALALLQSPGMRHLLRQRAVPAGMTDLLAAASGPEAARTLQLAATQGCDPAHLCEAARFYAREVLFHPGADAYRILGVDPAASDAQLKSHHRLLQQWLHPDRLHEGEDSVFAARVNTAWNQLRTPERRQEHDRLNPPVVDPRELRVALRRTPAADPDAIGMGARVRRRAPVLVLLLACGVLAVMAVRDETASPMEGVEDTPAIAAAPLIAVPRQATPAPRSHAPARRTQVPAPAFASTPPHRAHASTPPSIAHALAPPPAASPASRMPMPHAPVLPTNVQPTAVNVGDAPDPDADARIFERAPEAHRVGDQLLHYLSRPRMTAPPIWNSAGAMDMADRVRARLDQRNADIGTSEWRLREREARLRARLVPDEAGTVQARLVWRENHWLVADVAMESP